MPFHGIFIKFVDLFVVRTTIRTAHIKKHNWSFSKARNSAYRWYVQKSFGSVPDLKVFISLFGHFEFAREPVSGQIETVTLPAGSSLVRLGLAGVKRFDSGVVLLTCAPGDAAA